MSYIAPDEAPPVPPTDPVTAAVDNPTPLPEPDPIGDAFAAELAKRRGEPAPESQASPAPVGDEGAEPSPSAPSLPPEDLPPAATGEIIDSPPVAEPGDGSSATVPPAPAAPTDFDAVDANAVLEEYLGHKPDRQQMTDLMNFWSTAANADQQRQGIVDFVLRGGDLAELGGYLAPPSVATTPPPAPVPQPVTPQADEWGNPIPQATVPPEVQARLDALEAQVAASGQTSAQLQQQQHAAWQQQMVDEQRNGSNEWAQSAPFEITPEHLAILENKVAQSGIFPVAYQRNNNNPRLAMKEALDYIVKTDPAESQRLIDAQVAAKMAEQEDQMRRQQKMSSISAGGGAPPNLEPQGKLVGGMSAIRDAIAQDVRTNLFGDGSAAT